MLILQLPHCAKMSKHSLPARQKELSMDLPSQSNDKQLKSELVRVRKSINWYINFKNVILNIIFKLPSNSYSSARTTRHTTITPTFPRIPATQIRYDTLHVIHDIDKQFKFTSNSFYRVSSYLVRFLWAFFRSTRPRLNGTDGATANGLKMKQLIELFKIDYLIEFNYISTNATSRLHSASTCDSTQAPLFPRTPVGGSGGTPWAFVIIDTRSGVQAGSGT